MYIYIYIYIYIYYDRCANGLMVTHAFGQLYIYIEKGNTT